VDSGASSASTVWRQVATSGEPEKSARRSSRVISVRRFDFFQPIAVLAAARYWVQRPHLFALVAEDQGTTEYTEHTEAWHNRGRIYFRVFGVFCG
jgi:hypothetical protein